MTTSAIDVDEVRAALQPRAVLEFYGWKVKRSGDEFESSACPARGDHSRRAFLVNASSGRWRCFPCATSGDLFDFIAAVERLNMPAEFSAVLAKAAEIAGVGPSTLSAEERDAKRAEWKERQRVAEQKEREERKARDAAAIETATAYWDSLDATNARGIEYLRARGVEAVLDIPNAVRFDPKHGGAPAIPLFNWKGQIHNVVVRRFPEFGEPKTPGLPRCPTWGTLGMRIELAEAHLDTVITEGLFDTLSALVVFRKVAVFGGHGADNVPKIVKRVAPFIARSVGRLFLVPHQDRRGFEVSVQAAEHALDAGLSIRGGSLAIIKHPEKDLNDAIRAGWRPGP